MNYCPQPEKNRSSFTQIDDALKAKGVNSWEILEILTGGRIYRISEEDANKLDKVLGRPRVVLTDGSVHPFAFISERNLSILSGQSTDQQKWESQP